MSDRYFREILGVSSDATPEQIRMAWRRRVMENHPDRFPGEQKALQELAMITLTEAYNALMSGTRLVDAPAGDTASRPRRAPRPANARRPADAPRPPRQQERGQEHGQPGNAGALSAHRDPAYAYYKQGFINFSLAIHGIAEINRRLGAGRVPAPRRRYKAADDIRGSLEFLRAAHGWFSRVAADHAESVWSADARMKLRRIEHFTNIYRRILANLGRG